MRFMVWTILAVDARVQTIQSILIVLFADYELYFSFSILILLFRVYPCSTGWSFKTAVVHFYTSVFRIKYIWLFVLFVIFVAWLSLVVHCLGHPSIWVSLCDEFGLGNAHLILWVQFRSSAYYLSFAMVERILLWKMVSLCLFTSTV